MRPEAAARNAYTESAVLTAPPGRLVVMLYDGAIRFLVQSAAAMEAGDRPRARERMRRAEAIVDELNITLDMSRGDIPIRLRGIYLWWKRQLREANVQSDPKPLERVIRQARELRESWDRIATVAESQTAA